MLTGSYAGVLSDQVMAKNIKISNVHAEGNLISSASYGVAGGLVGYNSSTSQCTSTYENCSTNLNIKLTSSAARAGGLIGTSDVNSGDKTNIINCLAMGTIEGDIEYIGGLLGAGKVTKIESSGYIGSIKGKKTEGYIGGLISYLANSGPEEIASIKNSFASIKIEGINNSNSSYTGGIIGMTWADQATIDNTLAIGSILMPETGDCKTGGFLGSGKVQKILNSQAVVNIKGNNSVGGFAGQDHGSEIQNCYAAGTVEGKESVGGFIGAHHGSNVSNSKSRSRVKGTIKTGGFVGANYSSINNCHAIGTVEGTENTGGFAGANMSQINKSYSNAIVKGTDAVGGFAGTGGGGTITKCYALGTVEGTTKTGGFLGKGSGNTIENSYTKAKVVSAGTNTGGFIGAYSWETITNCYAANSTLTGTSAGGFIGEIEGETGTPAKHSFWDKTISGVTISATQDGLQQIVGKTTIEMKNKTTYIGWDFNKIWKIDATKNDGYPYLR